jgi:hypothetical protein
MPSLRAVLPAAAAGSVVLLAGILYCIGYRAQYYALAEVWGAAPFRTPFLDIRAVTAAVQCHRLGFDVYVQNPCDVFGRVHGYSPVWLWLAVLPITTAWDNGLGLGLVLLFLIALAFLPAGRDWRQTMLITLGAVSSATMFALERANVDLLMFVMAMLAVRSRTAAGQSDEGGFAIIARSEATPGPSPGACAQSPSQSVMGRLLRYARNDRRIRRDGISSRAHSIALRTTGYAVSLLAGILKFYPIVLLVLAVRERLVTCLVVWAVAVGVIALWFALDGTEILRGLANIPFTHPFDDNVFGAHNLPFGLAELLGLPHAAAIALQVVLLVIVLGLAATLARRVQVHALTEAQSLYLLAGSALLVSCFVMAQNVSYRGIYFLFVLPALAVCRRGTAWLILLLMWNSALRPVVDAITEWSSLAGILRPGIWLVRELAWWGVITILMALLLRQVWESRAVAGWRERSVAIAYHPSE